MSPLKLIYCTAISFALSTTLYSQIALTERSFIKLAPFAAGETTAHLAEGDLDGDGVTDIAASNFGGKSISLFRNISIGGVTILAPKHDLATTDRAEGVAIADLNQDGKPEVIASITESYLSYFINKSTPGNLSFDPEVAIPTDIYATGVWAADIDGDGWTDIAVENNQSNKISFYSNIDHTGGVNLQVVGSVPTNLPPADMILADINNDNKPDLIVSNYFTSSISVYVNLSTSGSFAFGDRIDYATDNMPGTIRAGDINGDSKPDLVVGFSNLFKITVFVNRSLGDVVSFDAPKDLETGQTPQGIAITDLDNDGKNDIATGNYSENTISVLMNGTASPDDTLHFAKGHKYDNSNTGPYDMIAFDVEGDGYKDLITANFGAASISIFNNRLSGVAVVVPVITSISPTAGPIGTTVTINGGNFSTSIAENKVYFGSIEAQVLSATTTRLTVQVPAGATFGFISVVRNSYVDYSPYPFNVTFPGGGGGVVFNIDFLSKQMDLSSNNPRTIRFADFDGDGKTDIAFTQQVGDKLTVYRNASIPGVINYIDRIDLNTGPDPFNIAVADFDGNGKPDMAITNLNSGRASSVSFFRNVSTTGNISFSTGAPMELGEGANGIVAGDFNFDGKIDIGVSAGNSGYFYYLKNVSANGNISFEPLEDVRNWNHSSTMIEADIDGDGIGDVITTNFTSQSITVNINDGTPDLPIFRSSADFAVGKFPSPAVVGDLDGDGKLDVIVGNYGDSSVSVLRNISSLGSPAFDISNIRTGKSPRGLSLGDLDGDGKLEILVTSDEPGKLGIHKNLSSAGDIEFGEEAYFQAGADPTDVECADIDGDGKTDVAVASGYSTVSILRNTFAEALVTPSGTNPVYGVITQETFFDSTVQEYGGQPYVQRHYDVLPANNPDGATGTVKLYFRQSDFDAFNAHPHHGLSLPMSPTDSVGITNIRVYQYHGTSTEGSPGTYSGNAVVIDPDDSRIVWNADTEWWEISFEVNGFSGFFVSVGGNGMIPPSTAPDMVAVYPNPAYGRTLVKHPVSENAFIRIIDMRGNIVRRIPIANTASSTSISLYGLSSGLYNIVWQNASSRHVRKLMVK